MTWTVKRNLDYAYIVTDTDTVEHLDCGYITTDGILEFQTDLKEDAEWLCNTLEDYDTLKKKLDSLSRSVLCDNLGTC